MLPVSITAILIRIIFKLKLADIIINVTSGGPGGATDSVTSFIFREYRDRSNVGYGTLLAMFYLVLIVIVMTILMKLADRWMKPQVLTWPTRSSATATPTAASARKWWLGRVAIYAILILWAFICLFPIYWTLTTSFKAAPDVMQGNMIPWVDYAPESGSASARSASRPTRSSRESTVARRIHEALLELRHHRARLLARSRSILGSCAAYGLSRFSYRFGYMRNGDISFFFLSQLILPPVVLALPFLVLYKELALLDTRIGLILLYTLTVLPIVIWIMRDQFASIPTELEEAALVDGLLRLGRVPHDHPAHRAARHGRGLHPQPRADVERILLRRPPHLHEREHAAGDGREPDRIAGHHLVVDGRALLRRDPAPHHHRRSCSRRYIIKGMAAGAVK